MSGCSQQSVLAAALLGALGDIVTPVKPRDLLGSWVNFFLAAECRQVRRAEAVLQNLLP